MRNNHRRRQTVFTGLALAGVIGAGLSASTSPAGADESRAACVAVLTHDPTIGAPGAAQRRLHLIGFGKAIAAIADQPKGQCVYPFGGGGR